MSDDFKFEIADSDYVDSRMHKICKIVAAVEPEIDMEAALVTDLSSLYDFCCMSKSRDDVHELMTSHFGHKFDNHLFGSPLWMLVDYIDAQVGWPDETH